MEQMKVSSVVSLLPETKSQITDFVAKIEQTALEGYESPLYLYKQAKNMEAIAKELNKSAVLKDAALTEAQKYHKDELKSLHNSKIEICELGTKWNYDECNHPDYDRTKKEIERLTQKLKGLEDYLKTVENETEYIDPQTGECVKLLRATKTSTTGLKITLNK